MLRLSDILLMSVGIKEFKIGGVSPIGDSWIYLVESEHSLIVMVVRTQTWVDIITPPVCKAISLVNSPLVKEGERSYIWDDRYILALDFFKWLARWGIAQGHSNLSSRLCVAIIVITYWLRKMCPCKYVPLCLPVAASSLNPSNRYQANKPFMYKSEKCRNTC